MLSGLTPKVLSLSGLTPKVLSGEGAEPVGSTPEEYEQFTRSEIEKWIKVARGAGIQPE